MAVNGNPQATALDELFRIASLVPWWVEVALAGVAYFAIHRYAIAEIPLRTVLTQVQALEFQLWKSAAAVGQYAVPGILIVAAGMSAFQKYKRKKTRSAL